VQGDCTPFSQPKAFVIISVHRFHPLGGGALNVWVLGPTVVLVRQNHGAVGLLLGGKAMSADSVWRGLPPNLRLHETACVVKSVTSNIGRKVIMYSEVVYKVHAA
jgi:hypothetical protein